MASSLTIANINAGYGAVRILEDVSLRVGAGETVALLGTNGNGKSTLMKSVMGMVRPSAGSIKAAIEGTEHELVGRSTEEIVDLGIGFVPEGRRLFTKMSVEENLELGCYLPAARGHRVQSLERVFTLFPILRDKRQQPAGELSGGQQQMVAIGRALMARPRIVLFDEPSLGLAPTIVDDMFDIITRVRAEGAAVLLVEQNVLKALEVADRAYVLEQGRIVTSGLPDELLKQPHIREAYLGV